MPSTVSTRIVFCLVILLISRQAFSQENIAQLQQDNFPFHHIEYLNSDQGLNGNEVFRAIQDKNGFMWFITDFGLNRYDGYSFRSYVYRPDDPNSISTDWYYGLVEDNNGALWIPSSYQGLYSFDPYKEKFTHYRYHVGSTTSLSNDWLTTMNKENDSVIWSASSYGIGLDKFDLRTQSFTHFYFRDIDSATPPVRFIGGILPDNNKTPTGESYLWLIGNNGSTNNTRLYLFDTRIGKIVNYYDFPFHSLLNQHAIKTDVIKNETIWIGNDDNGVHGFNTLTREFIIIKPGHPCRRVHTTTNGFSDYYCVMEDHAGNLWTTNDDNEIVYYDRTNEKFYYQPIQKDNVRVGYIFEDRSQRVWICTDHGLIAVDTKQKDIFVCKYDGKNPRSISGNFIGGIYRAKYGPLFVASYAIDTFDKKTKSFHRFAFKENGKEINTTWPWAFYEDDKDNLWISGLFGVASYNHRINNGKLYHFWFNNNIAVNSTPCHGIIEDKKGRYWVPVYFNGLYSLDPATSKVRILRASEKPGSLTTNQIAYPYEDSRGTIYINGWGGGFITFNPDSETFKIYHHDPRDPTSVSHETSHSFLETKGGLILFGTMGGGINVFNPTTGKFKSFTTRDGLAHDNVSSLVADKNGYYWAGTAGGISCFSLPGDPFSPGYKIKFRNYDVSDGLPSRQLNWNSAFCDTDGTLYFGTNGEGLFYFYPDSLRDNDFKPPVYITEFWINNKLISVKDTNSVLQLPIEFTKEVKLNYKQNIFSFSFAALNYIHPEKNQYAYMLEGYDKDWIYTDASRRFVTYTNLGSGHYTFKVKGSNNDGLWNEIPTELRIIITPPFWKTTWFSILIALAALAIIYSFYRYRVGQILVLQKIRNKIAADLHDDIGSTLNSISVYSEVAKKDPSRKDFALNMIGESSRKIIDSMSDIVWSINPENDSFEKIVFRMRSLAYNLMKAKKIDCSFKADESLNELKLPMHTRRNFYLIFKETLNNLVKYSQALRASVTLTYENRQVLLVVRDDGIGFDPTAKHNGNGLHNIRKRAGEINARLSIESSTGTGTTVELNFRV